LLSVANARGADSIDKDYHFDDSVSAGQQVTIVGEFLDEGIRTIQLKPLTKGASIRAGEQAKRAEDKKSLSFTLPADLPDGRYMVEIYLGGVPTPVGELRVPRSADAKVNVETVEPVNRYPDDQNRYGFLIAGTNFASTIENNHVEINKQPLELPICSKTSGLPCLRWRSGAETRALIVDGYVPPGFGDPLAVSLRVGNGTNVSEQLPVTFSKLREWQLKALAGLVFSLLLLIVYLLVRTGIKLGKIDSRFASLRAFVLDRETNSYSLSKFQLILFTLVAVFGYIYIFVCHLAVQWRFELPSIPEGLPSMMAVSLGTTVVATGVAASIGAKGAGPDSPSFADFISSGGVVLPERFQFFLWTIVSSVGLLVLVLVSDPVTIKELPKLPDGLLALIGLSSAGYLGGKLLRGPGPSIKSIDVAKVVIPGVGGNPDVTILEATLSGDNLSIDATFQLDDEHIPKDQTKVVDSTPTGQNPKLCSMLKVRLENVAVAYFEKPHIFRIVNTDSQGADIKYGATVEPLSAIPAGAGPIQVKVTGANFKDPSSAVWTDAARTVTQIPTANIKKNSETELEITLTPGATTGPATLAIKSPGELTTTVDVTVA
jgi:hypothetical protein